MPPVLTSTSVILRRLPHVSATALRHSALRRVSFAPSSSTWIHHRFASTMNSSDLTHYLADQPPSVVRLEIEKHFEPLSDQQKRYAHFISKYVFPLYPLSEIKPRSCVQLCSPAPLGLPSPAAGLACVSCRQSQSPYMT